MSPEPLHILIIDDNPDDRAEIRRMLLSGSGRCYRFTEAQMGAQGIRLCRENTSHPPDCILLDYNLPDMDARKVLLGLCDGADLPPCPVVVVTGFEGNSGQHLLRLGAQDFIGKAWTTAASLTRVIENAIERFMLLTENRRVQQKLRENDEQLAALLAQLPLGVGLTDAQGRWLVTNSLLHRFVGDVVPSEGAKAGQQFKAWSEDGSALDPLQWPGAKALRGETVAGIDLLHTSESGVKTWTRISSAPFRNQTGEITGSICVVQDIDARKRVEEELRLTTERFQLALRDSSIVVFNQDLELRYTWVYNPSLGYESAALLGKRDVDILERPEDAAITEAIKTKVIRTGESDRQEVVIHWKGKDLYFDLLVEPLRDPGGAICGVTCAAVDITERKQTEVDLRQTRAKLGDQAEHLQKVVAARTAKLQTLVAELSHLSYAMVHDMRAPLRAVDGFITLLEQDDNPNSENLRRDYFRRIRGATRRMDQLIADSFNYVKILEQKLALEPVDLNELIPGLVESYPNLQPFKDNIQIKSPMPIVLGNGPALAQCFSNLLGNAVKFVNPDTKPRIRLWAEVRPPLENTTARPPQTAGARSTNESEPALHPQFDPPDPECTAEPKDMVRVWVEDNGIGIPQNSLRRVFGMFQRVSTRYEGTGIGLAIVFKLVERMGGRVGVESTEGKGSRFWVDLLLATKL